jgi:hypothetical protein
MGADLVELEMTRAMSLVRFATGIRVSSATDYLLPSTVKESPLNQLAKGFVLDIPRSQEPEVRIRKVLR